MTASPLWRPATNLKPHMCNSAPSQSHEGRKPSQLIPPKLAVSLVRMIFIKFKRRARYSLPCKPSRSTWNERTPATAAAAFARSSPGTRTSTSSNRAGRRRPRSCRRRKRRRPSLRSSLAEAWRTTRSSRTGSASASSTARTWGEMDSERPKAGFVGPEQIVKFEVYCYGTRDRKVSESSPKWGRVQARSQGLRFGREKHIFRGARFLFSSYVWSSFSGHNKIRGVLPPNAPWPVAPCQAEFAAKTKTGTFSTVPVGRTFHADNVISSEQDGAKDLVVLLHCLQQRMQNSAYELRSATSPAGISSAGIASLEASVVIETMILCSASSVDAWSSSEREGFPLSPLTSNWHVFRNTVCVQVDIIRATQVAVIFPTPIENNSWLRSCKCV